VDKYGWFYATNCFLAGESGQLQISFLYPEAIQHFFSSQAINEIEIDLGLLMTQIGHFFEQDDVWA
jgi:predicted transcriptional regulator